MFLICLIVITSRFFNDTIFSGRFPTSLFAALSIFLFGDERCYLAFKRVSITDLDVTGELRETFIVVNL